MCFLICFVCLWPKSGAHRCYFLKLKKKRIIIEKWVCVCMWERERRNCNGRHYTSIKIFWIHWAQLNMTHRRMDAVVRLWRWCAYMDWSPTILQANRIHYPDKYHSKNPYCNHCPGISMCTTVVDNCHNIVAEDLYFWCWRCL